MGLSARVFSPDCPGLKTRAELLTDSRRQANQTGAKYPCQDGPHSSGEAPAIFCTVVMALKILKLVPKG